MRSPIVGDDVMIERYQIPPHLLFYSEINGTGHNRKYTYDLERYKDDAVWNWGADVSERYYGLPTHAIIDGWDEVRQPWVGNMDWEQRRESERRANNSRHKMSLDELESENYPWRTTDGDNTWSISEVNNLCKHIFKGNHHIADVNKRETLRCINKANIMFRDTLRDTDEGEACSEASSAPKKDRKSKKRLWPPKAKSPH